MKNIKKLNLSYFTIVSLLIVIICSGSLGIVAFVYASPTTTYITSESFGKSYDFKVGYNSDLNYYFENGTSGTIVANHSDAETLIEWTIDNASHYDEITFTSQTFDINDEIDDMGKNGITISGTWGTIFDIDTKSDTKHGFALMGVDDWTFDGVQFEAETVAKGNGGFESGAIYLRDANGITITNVLFDRVNGYCIRIDSSATPTYCTNLEITYNTLNDSGHNFFGGAGVNFSLIHGNNLFKDGDDLDDEHIWLGARDLSTDIGCFYNIISENVMRGGSIAINLDEYTTNNSLMVSYNTIIDNQIIIPVDDSGRNDPVIYCNADNNRFEGNIIINDRIGQTTGCIVLTDEGAGEPREGNQIINNHITHNTGSGISGWNVAQSGTIIIGNIIRGNTAQGSMSFNDAGNTNCTVIGNVCGDEISFDNTLTTNQIANNVEDIDS